MSALIKIKELLIIDNSNEVIEGSKSTFIVVPFIKSFNCSVVEKYKYVAPIAFDMFGITDEEKKSSARLPKLKVYLFEYIDTSDDYPKSIYFQYKEDAERFISELKSCINDFYKNADAYIKFIN